MNNQLTKEIYDLICTKREGANWDFKESHHENKAALLHDILCLANSITKSNKYLIYGVADPSNDCEVKGINGNRRTQTNIIDFIRSKKFSADCRPEIELITIEISNKEIDVLVIYDHPEKPYYITEDYRDQSKCVRANFIYTRNLDTNTPINKSADNRFIEAMWRERFGLDLKPAERMLELLKSPHEWDKDVGNKEYAYHMYNPEFQIQFGEVEKFTDIYSFFHINNSSFIGTASFRYLSTELFCLPYVYCDEMRVELAEPINGSIRVDSKRILYMYYILNDRNGAFHHFLTDGSFDTTSGRMGDFNPFLLFRDQTERKSFESYLQDHYEELEQIEVDDLAEIIQKEINDSKEVFAFNAIEMDQVQKLFIKWKKNLTTRYL